VIYIYNKNNIMSKLNELLIKYKEENQKLSLGLDDQLIESVTKDLGPSIYNEDSELVSCGDKSEVERIKTSFLIGKLGLTDSDELDIAIEAACLLMGTSNKSKYRALLYALLVNRFDVGPKLV
jgi:hypothetical protein